MPSQLTWLNDNFSPQEPGYSWSHCELQSWLLLTIKVPITTAADDKYFFIVFQKKIRLDVSSESSARQRIHMKNQALIL